MQEDAKPFSQVTIDEAALAHSELLQSVIRDEISQSGPMPFDRFMQLALYAPGLGYYTAGSQKFGASGDFVTAPEISSLFSQCLANQCKQVLDRTGGSILEFGAGSGIMAAHILQHLQAENSLPAQYFILDLSPDLKERQQQVLEKTVPDLIDRVVWLEQMPETFNGVILANEVLDAMPVSIFGKQDGNVMEQFVAEADGRLQPTWQTAGSLLASAVRRLEEQHGVFPDGYTSEINMRLNGWLQSLSSSLHQGVILLIDYGYTAAEYYHAERSMGTLICHYRHRAHDDPFKLIGLQDITANVDFSAVRDAGVAAGLQLAGFTPQANFLVSSGIEDLLSRFSPGDSARFLAVTRGVKVLMLPSEMGERFKVIALGKKLPIELMGFSMKDLSERL